MSQNGFQNGSKRDTIANMIVLVNVCFDMFLPESGTLDVPKMLQKSQGELQDALQKPSRDLQENCQDF